MFKGWTNRWDELSVLADTAVTYAAYLLVVHIYLALHPPLASAQLISFYFSWSIFVLGASWLGLKLSFRGYSRRWNQLPAEIAMLFLANVVSGAGMAVLIFGLKATWFSRVIFVSYPAVAFLFQMMLHSATKVRLATWRRRGLDRRHLIVIGYPPRVSTFRDTVHDVPEAGMDVVGMAPVALGDAEAGQAAVLRLREWLTTQVVDSVVLALPLDDSVLRAAIRLAENQGKEVRLVLDEVGALANRSQLYNFYGNSVLVVNPSQAHLTARWIVKRAVDMVGALALIVLSSPIMLTVAILLKWRERGAPVLFRQVRVGLNGRRFTCYKFRTMVPEAEALREAVEHLNIMSGPVFKAPDDPRITPLGRKLRQYSLDELPQLFNVLVGQMSLVGPRPALPDEVEKYGDSSRKRLSVRPGITGLWQVSGRNEIQDFDRWVALDLEYIDHWSVGLDFAILARTIPAVLQQRGAH
jgi:exopolysaccharide biosynthesis polyprenyl glycosylphosphotransferase